MPDAGETSVEQSSASGGAAMLPLPGEAESGEQPVQESEEAGGPAGDSEKAVEGLSEDMPSDRKP